MPFRDTPRAAEIVRYDPYILPDGSYWIPDFYAALDLIARTPNATLAIVIARPIDLGRWRSRATYWAHTRECKITTTAFKDGAELHITPRDVEAARIPILAMPAPTVQS